MRRRIGFDYWIGYRIWVWSARLARWNARRRGWRLDKRFFWLRFGHLFNAKIALLCDAAHLHREIVVNFGLPVQHFPDLTDWPSQRQAGLLFVAFKAAVAELAQHLAGVALSRPLIVYYVLIKIHTFPLFDIQLVTSRLCDDRVHSPCKFDPCDRPAPVEAISIQR